METKANYVIVGFFTLLAMFLLVIFAVWTASKGSSANTIRYNINFPNSVSGLSVGNDVRLSGIRIGVVKSITLDRQKPGSVHVIVEVDAESPIRENTEAVLNLQGITGLATVALTGGTADSPMLVKKHGEEMATIKAGKSTLDSLIAEAPDLISAATELLRRANGVITPENQENLRVTLDSLAKLSTTLADSSSSIKDLVTNLDKISNNLNSITMSLDKTISSDLAATLHSVRNTTNSLDNLMKNIAPGVERFSKHTLDEAQRAVADIRELVRTMDTVLQKLDNNPSRFFFGDKLPEFNVR